MRIKSELPIEVHKGTKQDELDRIERFILIKLFGKDVIPEITAAIFNLLKVDPNKYVHLFEEKFSPFLNMDGTINGKTIKNLISYSKYKCLLDSIEIPDNDFYVSDHVQLIFQTFFPGGNNV